jgi:hypothetical protein
VDPGWAMTLEPQNSSGALQLPDFDALPQPSSEAYQRYRQYIEHENLLVNFRTTWAIGANSFLLLAFGTTLTSTSGPHVEFLVALSTVGIFVNVASWVSVEAAFSALHSIKTRWERLGIKHPFLPPITGAGDQRVIRFGHFGSRFLLFALAIIWAGLEVYSLSRNPAPAPVVCAVCHAAVGSHAGDLLQPRPA